MNNQKGGGYFKLKGLQQDHQHFYKEAEFTNYYLNTTQ